MSDRKTGYFAEWDNEEWASRPEEGWFVSHVEPNGAWRCIMSNAKKEEAKITAAALNAHFHPTDASDDELVKFAQDIRSLSHRAISVAGLPPEPEARKTLTLLWAILRAMKETR